GLVEINEPRGTSDVGKLRRDLGSNFVVVLLIRSLLQLPQPANERFDILLHGAIARDQVFVKITESRAWRAQSKEQRSTAKKGLMVHIESLGNAATQFREQLRLAACPLEEWPRRRSDAQLFRSNRLPAAFHRAAL